MVPWGKLARLTNDAAQTSLTVIEILALCADALPNELPPAPESGAGGRGGRSGPPAPPATGKQ